MTRKERYNAIIADIEDLAADPFKKVKEILSVILQKAGMNSRDFSAVISFMTGKSAVTYIRDREFMAGYNYLITEPTYDENTLLDISDMGDRPAFDKKFKKVFGITPTDALKNRDPSLFIAPPIWNDDAYNFDLCMSEIVDDAADIYALFGISKEQYNKVTTVYDLACLYGFDKKFSRVAVEISEELTVSIHDAFGYIDALRDYGGDFSDEDNNTDDSIHMIERLREVSQNKYYQFAYFTCNISISAAEELLYSTIYCEKDLMEIEPRILYAYVHLPEDGYINFQFFMKAYKYYMQHKTDAYGDNEYEQFIEYLADGYYIETAFDAIIPRAHDVDDYYNPTMEEDTVESLEALLSEEEREISSWNGTIICAEYDADNPIVF